MYLPRSLHFLLSAFFIPEVPFSLCHLLFAWRTSSSRAVWALFWCRTRFSLSRHIDFVCIPGISVDIVFYKDGYFQPLKTIQSYGFCGFWWEICRYSHCCYSVCNESLFFGCFPDSVSGLISPCWSDRVLFSSGVYWALWIFTFVFCQIWDIFNHLVKNFFYTNIFLLLLGIQLTHTLNFFILSHKSPRPRLFLFPNFFVYPLYFSL